MHGRAGLILTSIVVLSATSLSCSSPQSTVGGQAGGTFGGNAGVSGAGTGGAGASGGVTTTGGVGGASGAAGVVGQGGASVSGASGSFGGASGNGGSSGGAGASGAAGTSGGAEGGGAAGGSAGAGGSDAVSGSGGAGGALPNITIWIAGDSTVATGGPCPIGWGGQFAPHFTNQVTVKNSAVAGRSVRTWLYDVQTTMDTSGECVLGTDTMGQPTIQAHWTAMLTGMKAGDYLFIQFGINDSDSTCPRHVGIDAFKTTYGMMAQAAQDRGAQPVFVTPVSAIQCTGNTAHGTRGAYVTATQDAGTQYGVPVIDLHALSVALYNMRGFCPIPGGGDVSATTGGDVGAFFCDDHTHFDTPGAIAISDLVAQAVKDQGLGLSAYLN